MAGLAEDLTGGGNDAAKWQDGSLIRLPSLASSAASDAFGINDQGIVVECSGTDRRQRVQCCDVQVLSVCPDARSGAGDDLCARARDCDRLDEGEEAVGTNRRRGSVR